MCFVITPSISDSIRMEFLKSTFELTFTILVFKVLFALSWNKCLDYTKFPTFHLLPQGKECGVISARPRILGGEDTSNGELPFMASIAADYGYAKTHTCGGTIISKRYILTAAHCVDAATQERIITRNITLAVAVGDHRLDRIDEPDSTGKYIPVEDLYIHHEYDTDKLLHDIALLRLAEDISFNKFVSPVCLPLDCKLINQNVEGEFMLVAGWGYAAEPGSGKPVFKDVLQKIWLPVTSQALCEKRYNHILDSHICLGGAKEYKHDKDACEGDSGGPVLYPTKTSGYNHLRYVQMGLVSFGDDSCTAKSNLSPGVYTRVTSYVDWILNAMRE